MVEKERAGESAWGGASHCARGARSQAAAMAPSKSNQSAAQKREAFFGSINKEKVRE